MLRVSALLAIFGVLNGALADSSQVPAGAAYLDGDDSPVGVILLHGRGKHPRWRVVEPLRTGIHRRLGFHTLSLQMPISRSGNCLEGAERPRRCWRQYASLFGEAGRLVDEAIVFLRTQKNVSTIFLIGHSMGARMGAAYLAGLTGARETAAIAGFVGVGMRHGGGRPLDTLESLRQVTELNILDVFGDGGKGRDAVDAALRNADGLTERPQYQQTRINGANHRFSNEVDGQAVSKLLVDATVAWMRTQPRR